MKKMKKQPIVITESTDSYDKLKVTLEKVFPDYEITTPLNQWSINVKREKCVIIKKKFWNAVCLEYNHKKKTIELGSVFSNHLADNFFRHKLGGFVGVLLMEPTWRKLRKEVYEVLQK